MVLIPTGIVKTSTVISIQYENCPNSFAGDGQSMQNLLILQNEINRGQKYSYRLIRSVPITITSSSSTPQQLNFGSSSASIPVSRHVMFYRERSLAPSTPNTKGQVSVIKSPWKM